ncbi:SLT-2 domain-containing protein [Plantibacter sp. RU18]
MGGSGARRPANRKARKPTTTRRTVGGWRRAPKPRNKRLTHRPEPRRRERTPRTRTLRIGWLITGGAIAIVGLAVVVAAIVWGPELVDRAQARDSVLGTVPHAAVEGPGIPAARADPATPAGIADRVDGAWAAATATRLGIPERAMRAYAGAALATAEAKPDCGIAWNTLAAIGSVESGHGTIFGGALDAHGRATPPIIGPALTGTEFDAITDTDRGALDGDTRWDRAVGPLQFIPSTWSRWGADGNGDGVADPQQIDDAALAAANYLCHGDRNLRLEADWIAAIGSYNGAASYLEKIVHAADTFAAN